MVVVLDAPGLKGEDQRHEHEGAHDVFNQVVLVKRAMSGIMTNHKELSRSERGQG